MSAEQPLKQVSSGAVAHRPREYGMEWGAYGLSTTRQAADEAGYNSTVFNFRSRDTQPDPSLDLSCLEVGVIFDVRLTKDPAVLQKPGGDFADVVPLHGNWVALFLGDATGRGATAALAVPQALYSLRQLLNAATGTPGTPFAGTPFSNFHQDPAQTLKRLNRHLCSPALPAACAAVSLSLIVLNTKTGEAQCACAGSEPPLILRSRGRIETVSAGRMALGVEIGKEFHSADFRLDKGDALLLATDGITRARKANGDGSKMSLHETFLRYEGLTALALEVFSLGGSPGRMARAVLSGARGYAGGSFTDHASVLVASRR